MRIKSIFILTVLITAVLCFGGTPVKAQIIDVPALFTQVKTWTGHFFQWWNQIFSVQTESTK